MNRKKWMQAAAAAALAAVLLIGSFPARAVSSGEIQSQIDALESRQQEMQAEIDRLKALQTENATQIRELVEQKRLVNQQSALLHEQVDNMNDQIAAYALLIADGQEDLDRAEQRLAALNQKNKERIRAMEEEGPLSYWAILFRARSFTDFLDRLNMVREIAASDRRRIQKMSALAEEIRDAKAVLVEEKDAVAAARESLKEKETELAQTAEKAQELMDQLIAKGAEFEEWMFEKEQLLAQLEQELAQAEIDFDKAKYEEWLATSVPPTTRPPAGGGGGTGGAGNITDGVTWLTPCDYIRVSSPFGWREHPTLGGQRFHNGVDLAAPCTPIYATRAGVVVIATTVQSESAGFYVMIDHGDGYRSVYMHMCRIPDVRVGDFVTAGQVIGCVGSTGWSSGSHLHFGISYNGEYVNPMDYIK